MRLGDIASAVEHKWRGSSERSLTEVLLATVEATTNVFILLVHMHIPPIHECTHPGDVAEVFSTLEFGLWLGVPVADGRSALTDWAEGDISWALGIAIQHLFSFEVRDMSPLAERRDCTIIKLMTRSQSDTIEYFTLG